MKITVHENLYDDFDEDVLYIETNDMMVHIQPYDDNGKQLSYVRIMLQRVEDGERPLQAAVIFNNYKKVIFYIHWENMERLWKRHIRQSGLKSNYDNWIQWFDNAFPERLKEPEFVKIG